MFAAPISALRSDQPLRLRDDLSFHALVPGAAFFATRDRVGPGRVGEKNNLRRLALLDLPAVLAVEKFNSGRRAFRSAVGKRVDANAVSLIRGCHLELDVFPELDVNNRRRELKIFRCHIDYLGRLAKRANRRVLLIIAPGSLRRRLRAHQGESRDHEQCGQTSWGAANSH